MRALLAALILFVSWSGFVGSDDNIYGPGGANLGPEGNPEQLMREIEQQRLQQEANDEYNANLGLILRQQTNGHYFVNGSVNDIPLVFAIDTGASYVTLPEQLASQAEINCKNRAIMETANGKVKACTGIIEKLEFGDFSLTNVQCLIAPDLSQALLGNNVLKTFKMIQRNGELRIFN